jgi:hypothetical protein
LVSPVVAWEPSQTRPGMPKSLGSLEGQNAEA